MQVEPARLDHPRPMRKLVPDALRELLGRARHRLRTELAEEPLLNVLLRQCLPGLFRQSVDDGLRCSCGSCQSEPGGDVELAKDTVREGRDVRRGWVPRISRDAEGLELTALEI